MAKVGKREGRERLTVRRRQHLENTARSLIGGFFGRWLLTTGKWPSLCRQKLAFIVT